MSRLPFVVASVGVEGGFDIPEEKYEYDEHVKIVILPEYLDIHRDELEGLLDMVKDRVSFLSSLQNGPYAV